MTTLHIEHPITGYEQWRAAFDRAADLRADGGVIAERVSQPIDDDRYIVVQLDFDDAARAAAFLAVLRTRIWIDPARAPGLSGSPRAVLLRPAVEMTAARVESGNDAREPGGEHPAPRIGEPRAGQRPGRELAGPR